MYFWNILDIEPTNDTSLIKKAYAKKLRIHHPEDDPVGYQTLREAYDTALKHVKLNATNEIIGNIAYDDTYEPIPVDSPKSIELTEEQSYQLNSIHTRLSFEEHTADIKLEIEVNNATFMEQVEALYKDFTSRIDIECWRMLFNSDVIWVLDNRPRISCLMLDFLDSHRYLPKEVWVLLNDNFNWCEKERTYYEYKYYEEDIITFIRKQINRQDSYNYAHLTHLRDADCDVYLSLMEQAYDAYDVNQLYDFRRIIEKAKDLFADDSELLLLEARMYLRITSYRYAIELLNRFIEIYPDNQDAYFYRATALYETNQIKEALQDFSKFFARTVEKKELPLHLAKGYFKLGNYEKAAAWSKEALKSKITYNEAAELLSQIYARMRSSLTNELERDPSNQKLQQKLDAIKQEIMKSSKIKVPSLKRDIAKKTFKTIFSIVKYLLLIMLIIFLIAVLFVSKIGIFFLIYYTFKGIKKVNSSESEYRGD